MPHLPPGKTLALDNPVWNSLQGKHQSLAETLGSLAWYPTTITPFIAVPAAGCLPDLDGARSRGFRTPAYFVGVIPDALPDGWWISSRSSILQMLPGRRMQPGRTTRPQPAESPASDEDDIRALGIADRPKMVDLARIAFPDFFRERTAELGDYLGIYSGVDLVAMAGERLAVEGLHEISGVCTHPAFAGRGYARRLTRALMQRHRRRDVGSFLHVSEVNTAARRLYESMGFVERANLPFAKVERRDADARSLRRL